MADISCPHCGTKLEANTDFCPSCGQNLQDSLHYKEDKTVSEMFFTTKGRLNRLRYFKRWLLIIFLNMVLSMIIAMTFMDPSGEGMATTGYILIFLLFVVFAAAHVFLMIRRLHDLNRSGFYYFLLVVPLVNVLFSLYVIFAPGTIGPNQYGPDPLEGKR
jgi:uncharacterized membrane protein YhaH (DUF805 family)